ncbi:MAG: integrase arm-type DNA-binding domain-containing protein [Alphaproteobacteria bacterium]|nr:integrase arm-type DNA-binding domain-containing protein [Alphaproteobacteria bacterium]MBL7097246.1 integrase arm-type DNA-binding domain-containing protein [Alphaproteobacteria bacterium]
MPLTALGVKNAKSKAKPYKLADEKGLYLLITPGGGKLWRFDYRHDEKRKTLAMGKWPDIELAVARERRDNARKRLANGEDPTAADKVEALAIASAFETVARNWHASAKTAWTPRYARLVLGRLEADIFPHIGKDNIDSIEAPRLLEVVRKVEERGAIEMAKRIKNYCSEVFMYGIAEGKCRRDPAADIRRALRKPRPKKHMAAVSPPEFPTLVARMHAYDGDEITRLALHFTLITMVRTQETRFARIEEFEDLDGSSALWRLSPERMKMSREHLVPLPHQAVTIIRRLREISPDSQHLFPGSTKTGVISENTMLYGLYRMGYHSRQTTHGLRRCASTILNETGKFESDWIETQLAHADDDKVRGAYNAALYLSHRRRMLQWWADFVEKPTSVYRIAA